TTGGRISKAMERSTGTLGKCPQFSIKMQQVRERRDIGTIWQIQSTIFASAALPTYIPCLLMYSK
ncbi:Uncharacterized protein PODLI_1B033843, partial [Podarcis lilfordi]